MAERYHLALALWALFGGTVLVILGQVVPQRISSHTLGAAGLAAALLGGWGSGRALPWVFAAGAVCFWGDRPGPVHALGAWVCPAAVISLLGVWAAVPDTEPALAAGCVLAPLATAHLVRGRSSGPAGTAALVVMVFGAVWVGSAGWGSALATCSAVGMVAVAPMVLGFGVASWARGSLSAVLLAHAAVAVPVSRVIMGSSAPVGWAIAVVALCSLAALATVVPTTEPDHTG